jgi:hypothetical protein
MTVQTRAAGERQQRHGVAFMAAEVDDGSSGQQRRRVMTMAMEEDDNNDGRR